MFRQESEFSAKPLFRMVRITQKRVLEVTVDFKGGLEEFKVKLGNEFMHLFLLLLPKATKMGGS